MDRLDLSRGMPGASLVSTVHQSPGQRGVPHGTHHIPSGRPSQDEALG